MHDADPAELYERQTARGDRYDEVPDLLDLDAGDALLDLGAGPGYGALRLADALAPGTVYALDRDVDALRYCRARASEEGIGNVATVAGDVAALPLAFRAPTAALAAFVLHHVDDPPTVLESVAGALPRTSPLLVLEYHPDAPGEYGPPIERRLDPRDVRAWLSDAGFLVEEVSGHPEEQYAVRARRE